MGCSLTILYLLIYHSYTFGLGKEVVVTFNERFKGIIILKQNNKAKKARYQRSFVGTWISQVCPYGEPQNQLKTGLPHLHTLCPEAPAPDLLWILEASDLVVLLFTLLSPHSGPYFRQQALVWPSVSLSDYPSGLLCRRKLIQDQGESFNTNCYWHSIPIETFIDSNNLGSAMPVLHTHLNHCLLSARLGRPCSLKWYYPWR